MDSFSNEMRSNVFVYGTLMRGESRHLALKDQVFVCDAVTRPFYCLFLVDDYPGLVVCEGSEGISVAGELWNVDRECLKHLDEIECVDSGLFERQRIKLESACESAEAWFYMRNVDRLTRIGSDWRLR